MTQTLSTFTNRPVDANLLRELLSSIGELDTQIDAASDTTAAGVRKIKNELADAHKGVYSDFASRLVTALKDQPADVVAGSIAGILKAISEAGLTKTADDFVSAEAEKNKANAAETSVSADELTSLLATRKEQYDFAKKIRVVLEMVAPDSIADIPEPKVMKGGRGKRGPNALSLFNFVVGTSHYSKFSLVAPALGFAATKDLRAAVDEALKAVNKKVKDFEDEPTWSVTLSNGTVIQAVKKTSAELAAEDEDDEPDDDVATSSNGDVPSAE